jgi:hypothetical protein
LSKLSLDAGGTSLIDQFTLTLAPAVALGESAFSVLPAPAWGQLQAGGANRSDPIWIAGLARAEPLASADTHGPLGREVVEAIRLSLMATH